MVGVGRAVAPPARPHKQLRAPQQVEESISAEQQLSKDLIIHLIELPRAQTLLQAALVANHFQRLRLSLIAFPPSHSALVVGLTAHPCSLVPYVFSQRCTVDEPPMP
jgi:hypothetical protein